MKKIILVFVVLAFSTFSSQVIGQNAFKNLIIDFPPFTNASSGHIEEITDKVGVAYGLSNSTNLPILGKLRHNSLASSFLLGTVGIGVADAIFNEFSVPYSGAYKITFNGNVTGEFYNISTSIIAGAAGGATSFWVDAGIRQIPDSYNKHPIYETDMSVGALSEKLAETAILGWLEIGDVISVINTLRNIASPEDNLNSEVKVEVIVHLEANSIYSWAFRAISSTVSASTGIAQNTCMLDAIVSLENVNIEYMDNYPPYLSNISCLPNLGNEDTNFEFTVHYFDADRDIPIPNGAKIYIYGSEDKVLNMELESGDAYNGVYKCSTTLPIGNYNYRIVFENNSNQSVLTDFLQGPKVYNSSNMTIIPYLSCDVDETYDFELRYRINDGEYKDLLLNVGKNDGIEVPPLGSVSLSLSSSENYTFENYRLMKNGELQREYSGSGSTINFTEYASGIFDLQINSSYTPQTYNVSGTINNEDNTPYNDALNIAISSSQEIRSFTSNNGSFSFGNVKGGIPIEIEASGAPIGYSINPEIIPIRNLKRNETDLRFSISSDDHIAPSIQIIQKPNEQSSINNIIFSWIGSDDISNESALLYQYKLDGLETEWTSWSNNKTATYNLTNGFYKLIINSKDEAGNLSNVPLEYSFIVNADPKIELVEKYNGGIWASKITLTKGSSSGSDVVLLPGHSLTNISSIIPIRLYRINETAPCGALDKIAIALNIDTVFISHDRGFILKLPDDFPESNKLEYIIEWGKQNKFGWKKTKKIKNGFPNISDIPPFQSDITEDKVLDNDYNLWRVATSKKRIETDDRYIYNSWLYFDKTNSEGSIINEKEINYLEGSWISGQRYSRPEFSAAKIFSIKDKKYIVAREEKYERTYSGTDNTDIDWDRYSIKILNSDGSVINTLTNEWKEDKSYSLPDHSINNAIWILNKSYNTTTNSLHFSIIDEYANKLKDEQKYYEVERSHSLYDRGAFPIGSTNILILFEDRWETDENDDRSNLCYQIYNINGTLVKSTSYINPPLLSDIVEEDDEYQFESAITDNLGRVWISYHKDNSGNVADDYFWIVLDSDGSKIYGPIESSEERRFRICDKDNYIWASEDQSGYIYLIDKDFKEHKYKNNGIPIPNQKTSDLIANVGYNSYNIFDRWSNIPISFNIDENTHLENIQLFNIPINDEVKLENIDIEINGSSISESKSTLPDLLELNISDKITLGDNLINLDQNSLLGGEVILGFPLLFATIPSSVILNDIGEITTTGGKISWTPTSTGSGAPTGYKLEVAYDAEFANYVPGYDLIDLNNVTEYNLTNISSCTLFYIRIRPYNAAGEGSVSETKSFNTKEGSPNTPTSIQPSDISSNSFKANWEPHESGCQVTNYILDVATDENFTSKVSDYDSINVELLVSKEVSNLIPNSQYFYRVQSNNAAGISSYSNSISVITLESPPDAPVAYDETNTTQTSFIANWSSSASAKGYRLDVATDIGFTTFVAGYNNKEVNNVTSFSVTDLSAETSYHYRVRAYNNVGASEHSNTISVITLENPPDAPVAYDETNITQTSFTANWSSSAAATGYRLDVATDIGFTSFVAGYNNKEVNNVTSFSVTNLSAETPYHYRVRAYNNGGASEHSNIISVVMLENPPVAPIAEDATDITQTSFIANWGSSATATGYRMDVATDIGFTSFVTGYNDRDVNNVTLVSVTNSNAGTPYYYRVRAYNDGGTSFSSNTITVTTRTNPSSVPTNLSAKSCNDLVTLNWDRSYGDDFDRYIVYGDNSINPIIRIDSTSSDITNTSIVIDGLENGQTSHFRVRAVNYDGVESDFSNQSTVTVKTGVIPKIIAKWGSVLICLNIGDSIESYQWHKENNTIPNASDQYYVTDRIAGEYKVEIVDINGCVNFSESISILGTKALSIFPNPTDESFTLKIDDLSEGNAIISLTNLLGVKVMEFQTEITNDFFSKEISVSNLAEGIYIVQVLINHKDLYYKKIVIKR